VAGRGRGGAWGVGRRAWSPRGAGRVERGSRSWELGAALLSAFLASFGLQVLVLVACVEVRAVAVAYCFIL
jgi:hypothetical protein